MMDEKELVRQLGEQIGYGNMMHLASECWEDYFNKIGYPTSGVFVPALKCDVKTANTTEDEPKVNVEQDKDIDAEKENYLCVAGVVYHLLPEDELVQAIDIIKSIEYIDVSDYFERDTKWKHCPECGYKEPDGHWKTCRIGLFLDKLQQEDSE